MLMAIGIGLAAGTQLTTVAYLASLVFVAISLSVGKAIFAGNRQYSLAGKIDKSRRFGNVSGDATDTPFNAQIEVHTTKVNAAQKSTAQLLESSTKQWQVADVIKNADETAIIVFNASLKKSVNVPTFLQDIKENGRGDINDVKLKGKAPERVNADAKSRN